MSDNQIVDLVVAAPIVAPVIEAPVVAPLVTIEAPVQAVEAPAVETTPVVETPVSEPVKPSETLLGEDPKVQPEIKPAEADKPVEGEQPKTEEVKSEEPAPTPVYDAFTLPEGVTLDDARVKEFTDILSDLETKAKGVDHTLFQEFGQKAVDFHVNEVKSAVEGVTKLYQTTWEKQKTDWKDAFLKDPEIGGNKFQTTVDSALTFIRTHGGTEEQQKEFRNLMETSGLGNHPAMIRILAKAGSAMSEGTPLAANKPLSPPKSKTATLYGGK